MAEAMLYTVKEVATILHTNTDFVYQLNKSGVLKFIKVGSLKCRKKTLEDFLEKYDGYDVSNPFEIKQL